MSRNEPTSDTLSTSDTDPILTVVETDTDPIDTLSPVADTNTDTDPILSAIDDALAAADLTTGTVPLLNVDAVRKVTRNAKARTHASGILNAVTLAALNPASLDIPRAQAAAFLGHAITVAEPASNPIDDMVRRILTDTYAIGDFYRSITDLTIRDKVADAVASAINAGTGTNVGSDMTAVFFAPDGFVPARKVRTPGTAGSRQGGSKRAGTVAHHVLLTIGIDGTPVTMGDLSRAVSGLTKDDGTEYHPTASSIRQALDNKSLPGIVRQDIEKVQADGTVKLYVACRVADTDTVAVALERYNAPADDTSDTVDPADTDSDTES